jgi:hypothetical protein
VIYKAPASDREVHVRVLQLLLVFFFLAAQLAFASGFGNVMVYSADQGPVYATVADLNHDGIMDLVVLNSVSNDVSVLLGNSDGTYQSPINYPVGLSPSGMVLTDFNMDGNGDVATANSGSNDISVLLGNADGTFQPAVMYSVGSGTGPHAITWNGFTSSGLIDLAVANSAGGTNNNGNVAIFVGNGDGTFQASKNYDTLGVQPVAITSAPLNSDGNQDIALANFASNSVSILLGDGRGGFTPGGDYPAGVGPSSITYFPNFMPLPLVVADSGGNSINPPL